jgi:hypothetical protein
MRNPVRAASVVATLALAGALLTACTPSAPVRHETKTPMPSPSATPIFASDAEALAAAVAVYKKFETVSDAIGHDGGANPERIKPYVSDEGYEFELKSAQKLQAEHAHGVGDTVLNNAILQSRDETGGWATVTIYVCEDISQVDRIGPDGKSLVEASRGDYIKYQAVFQGRSATTLVLHSNSFWSGDGVCKF